MFEKFRIEVHVESLRGGVCLIGTWKSEDNDSPRHAFFTHGGCGYGLESSDAILTNSKGYALGNEYACNVKMEH